MAGRRRRLAEALLAFVRSMLDSKLARSMSELEAGQESESREKP